MDFGEIFAVASIASDMNYSLNYSKLLHGFIWE